MLSENEKIIVLDLETTGLDHRTEDIIEVGAVLLDGDEITETFSSLVKPTVPIRHSSFQIHGITEEMVADAPTIDEVLPKILEFMGDSPFVAHNAIFDYSFLNQACKKNLERRLENLRIDTFEMFRFVFPDEHSHGLSSLLNKFGFDSDVKHRALDDARCLAQCYPKLKLLYKQQKSWQYSQLDNVPYLVERYLRIQKTTQMLQAEMGDLKEIFKLHFTEGGEPIHTSTNELMISSYRRTYEYDENELRALIKAAGIEKRVYKINTRAIDRVKDNPDVDDDLKEAIKDTLIKMTENRIITFTKVLEKVVEKDETPSKDNSKEKSKKSK